MVLETQKDNGFVPTYGPDGDTPPRPGVMGFWMPDSQQIAFCDQQAYSSEILMPTNSDAPIYKSNTSYNGIIGEKVDLEPAVQRGGLTYRYLQDETHSAFDRHYTVDKVVGRSAWVDIEQEATAFDAFRTGVGTDIVQLPEVR
jgi:hypothetical protein